MKNLFKNLFLSFSKKGNPKTTLETGIVTELIPTTDKIKSIVVLTPEEVTAPKSNPLAFRPILTKHELN